MNHTPNNKTPRTYKTAEELLLSGVDTKLTAREQSEMWADLKSYAEYHVPQSVGMTKSPFFTPFKILSGSFAIFVLLIGAGTASTSSLPGDFLYPVKVDVTEKVLGFIQVTDIAKLEYQGDIINNRLVELKELAKIKRLSEVEILIIEAEMTERGEEIEMILSQSNEVSVEENDSVRILSDILADVKTQKYIEDTVLGTSRDSKIDDTEENISGLYQEEISDFVTESPEEVNIFIEEALSSINDYVTKSEGQDEVDLEVRDFLVDVADALKVNDIESAVYFVGEAEQAIEFNEEVDSMNEYTAAVE